MCNSSRQQSISYLILMWWDISNSIFMYLPTIDSFCDYEAKQMLRYYFWAIICASFDKYSPTIYWNEIFRSNTFGDTYFWVATVDPLFKYFERYSATFYFYSDYEAVNLLVLDMFLREH